MFLVSCIIFNICHYFSIIWLDALSQEKYRYKQPKAGRMAPGTHSELLLFQLPHIRHWLASILKQWSMLPAESLGIMPAFQRVKRRKWGRGWVQNKASPNSLTSTRQCCAHLTDPLSATCLHEVPRGSGNESVVGTLSL